MLIEGPVVSITSGGRIPTTICLFDDNKVVESVLTSTLPRYCEGLGEKACKKEKSSCVFTTTSSCYSRNVEALFNARSFAVRAIRMTESSCSIVWVSESKITPKLSMMFTNEDTNDNIVTLFDQVYEEAFQGRFDLAELKSGTDYSVRFEFNDVIYNLAFRTELAPVTGLKALALSDDEIVLAWEYLDNKSSATFEVSTGKINTTQYSE